MDILPYDPAILFAACRALGMNYCNFAFAVRRKGPLAKLEDVTPGAAGLTAVEDLQWLLVLLHQECEKLGLSVAKDAVETCAFGAKPGAVITMMMSNLDTIFSSIYSELKLKRFLYQPPGLIPFMNCDEAVFLTERAQEGFPSIADDFVEASRCYALSRPTASVFHLMRCLEKVCEALARSLDPGVGHLKGGWGDYKVFAERKLADTIKGTHAPPSHWPASRTFYEDALAHLHAVYKAWRCTTMHLEATYSTEKARAIFDAKRALINDCAEHIDEQGTYSP